MTVAELHDRIYCWLWLYSKAKEEGKGLNRVLVFKEGTSFHWFKEMLIDIAELTIPAELEHSEIAKDLRLAIGYAKHGDTVFLPLIEKLLIKVETNIPRYVQKEIMQSVN